MPLTPQDLEREKTHFAERTARFVAAGYDRFGAPEFILDEAGAIEGPVLDVGTGMGLTARALAARGFDVISVDMNADDQQVAEFLTDDPELRRRIDFRIADAARLLFPAGYFGCAVAVDVLHHLDAGGPVLTELHRVVRPGGRIVVADFSADGFEMVARVHASEGHTHPEGPVTMDWTRGFLAGLGMAELKTSGDRFHRIAVFQAPRVRTPETRS
jgi:SAM-dependent methyltransferase